MSDDRSDAGPSPSPLADILRPYPSLPAWLSQRLLRGGERVTWVLGPWLCPWWERYVTHPLLVPAALALAVVFLAAGFLGGDPTSLSPAPFVGAAMLGFGSIIVLALFSGYFTRLVVTDRRLFILQGYELCRQWSIDSLPPSLVRFSRRGDPASRVIDLSAVQTMLGGPSDQVIDAKSILAFGKQLDRIQARDKDRPG